MKLDGIYFAGIGTAQCDQVTTDEAVERGWYTAEQQKESGMLSVSVAGTVPAPDLAVEAAEAALASSGHTSSDIGALFHSNTHPQGPEGWSASHYINRRTINQPVTSLEIRNGSMALFSSVYLAACTLGARPDVPAVLLTCADNNGTAVYDRWTTSSAFLLADGGGAVVLSRRGGFARVLAVGSACNPEMEEWHRGAEPLFPPTLTVGGTVSFVDRFEHARERAGQGAIPRLGEFGSLLAEAAKNVLAEAGTSMADVRRVVHDHVQRPSMETILAPLGVGEERGMWEFARRHGHAGSVDHVRATEHLWRNGDVGPGDRLLLVGGGAGMEAGCAVIEICEPPD